LADPGSVAYNFARKGVISITKVAGVTEDEILMAVLDAGAEEVIDQGGGFEVITEPTHLVTARKALQDAGLDYDSADAEFVPSVTIDIDAATARKVFALIDSLEDSDDVQNVFANFAIPADIQSTPVSPDAGSESLSRRQGARFPSLMSVSFAPTPRSTCTNVC
jgi:transcriptional/translational regulatory protein YebC/TACO1